MGVLTTTYAVPPATLKKLYANNELLEFLLGFEESDDPMFEVAEYEYDKAFEDKHMILSVAGYPTMHKTLDFELGSDEELDWGGCDIRVATPAIVKTIATELSTATFEEVKARCLAEECTDWHGKVIPEDEYDGLIGDLEKLKKFFADAASAGHAVIAAAG
jgi:hypothetical protein